MKHKKLISLILAAAISLALAAPAAAALPEEDVVSPNFTGVTATALGFDINEYGMTTDECTVVLRSGYTAIVKLHIQQLQEEDLTWDNVKSWEVEGSDVIDMNKIWYVASGYLYKLYMHVKVYNGDGALIEIITDESTAIFY